MDDATDVPTITVPTTTPRMIARTQGAVGWMIFNNPERRNAVSLDMWRAIPEILGELDRDPLVKVIVMSGAGGRAFVSGADISQFETHRHDAASAGDYTDVLDRAWHALDACGTPLVAAIEGFCFGAGVAIALRADVRVATVGSQFSIPAARLGVTYPYDSIEALVSLVGPSRAKWILFSAKAFDAAESHRMGLVDQVVAPGDLESAVHDIATTLAANAPLSIRHAKLAIDHIARGLGEVAEIEELAARCLESEDYREGRRAFMDKRPPVFTGR